MIAQGVYTHARAVLGICAVLRVLLVGSVIFFHARVPAVMLCSSASIAALLYCSILQHCATQASYKQVKVQKQWRGLVTHIMAKRPPSDSNHESALPLFT